MTPKDLYKGECYFLVTYHDEAMRLPAIETYVYLGKDILPGSTSSEPRWFFQTAESRVAEGPFDPRTGDPSRGLLMVGVDMIGDFCDVAELIAHLQGFAARGGGDHVR